MARYNVGVFDQSFLEELKDRKKKSKAYSLHQLLGLEVAQLLNDEAHKSLYIRLVKKHPGIDLLALAKDVATRKNVSNKGAYFMTVITEQINGQKKGRA